MHIAPIAVNAITVAKAIDPADMREVYEKKGSGIGACLESLIGKGQIIVTFCTSISIF
jgi:hypothetical protein